MDTKKRDFYESAFNVAEIARTAWGDVVSHHSAEGRTANATLPGARAIESFGMLAHRVCRSEASPADLERYKTECVMVAQDGILPYPDGGDPVAVPRNLRVACANCVNDHVDFFDHPAVNVDQLLHTARQTEYVDRQNKVHSVLAHGRRLTM